VVLEDVRKSAVLFEVGVGGFLLLGRQVLVEHLGHVVDSE